MLGKTRLTVLLTDMPHCARSVRASKSPWISAELKELMHQRDVFKIKAIQSKNPRDWFAFKKFRNSVNNEIKRANGIHYKKAPNEN